MWNVDPRPQAYHYSPPWYSTVETKTMAIRTGLVGRGRLPQHDELGLKHQLTMLAYCLGRSQDWKLSNKITKVVQAMFWQYYM